MKSSGSFVRGSDEKTAPLIIAGGADTNADPLHGIRNRRFWASVTGNSGDDG